MLIDLLRIAISLGQVYVVYELSRWAVRFNRDFAESRALVAGALAFLMASFAIHELWLVIWPVMTIFFADSAQVWNPIALFFLAWSVFAIVVSTYFLRFAFRNEQRDQQKDENNG